MFIVKNMTWVRTTCLNDSAQLCYPFGKVYRPFGTVHIPFKTLWDHRILSMFFQDSLKILRDWILFCHFGTAQKPMLLTYIVKTMTLTLTLTITKGLSIGCWLQIILIYISIKIRVKYGKKNRWNFWDFCVIGLYKNVIHFFIILTLILI